MSPPPPESGDSSVDPLQPPPAGETSGPCFEVATKAQRLQSFLDQARYILAEQRGVTAKSQMMLASAADELGLSREEAERAIASLQQTGDDVAAPPVAAPPVDSRWRTGEVPQRESGSPQELFRAYVDEALAKSPRHVVSRRKERKLIEEGKRKLGLSTVFARQIVRQVAADSGKTVVSLEEDEQSTTGSSSSATNPGVDEFLERAAAIIAEQRGINPTSRILLAAAAAELGLSDEAMEAAIASLQTSASRDGTHDVWQQERIESFREYMREVFSRLAHKVATSRVQQKWIDQGEQLHGLEMQQAREVIRELAAEQHVRIVSEDQAKDHVAGVVDQLIGDATRLNGPTRARIFSEGTQWGLDPVQVDAIIRERVRANRRKRSSERSLVGLALTAGIGVVCALLGFLAWAIFFGGDEGPEGGPIAQPPVVTAPVTPQTAAIESPTGREWWAKDEDLLVAVTKTRIVLPNMKGYLVGLNLKRPEARGRSYRELVRAAAAHVDNEVHRAVLRELLASCYVAEPSDQCASVLCEALLGLMPAVGDALPDDDTGYGVAFWVARTVLAALADASLDAARADQLVQAIGRTIGTTIDRTRDPPHLERQCLAALCQHLYRVIIHSAASQPLVAAPLYSALTDRAVRYLEKSTIESTNVDLLAVVLPQVGDAWHAYENLIQGTINSADPLIVLRVVELYEEVTDASLRDFLASRLLQRAGVYPGSLNVDEVARRVREAMGAKYVVTGRHRWKQLAGLAAKMLAEPDAPGAPAAPLLQQLVDLAHASTLGCALAQGEVGYATFDQLIQDGPPKLSASAGLPDGAGHPPSTQPGPAAAAQLQNVLRYIHYLADRRRQPAHRPIYLRGIASFASQVPELEPEPAAQLARYLMKPKSDAEQDVVLEHAEAVTRWKYVRLALADEVLDTNLQKERIQELFPKVLRRDIKLTADDWKQQAYEAMIRDVIDDLSFAADRQVGAGRVYDDASLALRDLYGTQARLLGVLPEQYEAAESPAGVLRLMIERYAAGLDEGSPADEARRHVTSLPRQFDAVQYAAANDLQRTVLLQKLWLRTLALGMTRSHAGKADRAKALVDDSQQADGNAGNLFAQLRNGERAVLQEWLLASPQD